MMGNHSFMNMVLIDAERTQSLLDYEGVIDALDAGHKSGVDHCERHAQTQPMQDHAKNHFILLPTWQFEQSLGIKLVTVFPDNLGGPDDLPSIQGLYILFDGANGQPVALLDGTLLTLWKTAADSALGARYLAPQDATCLLMAGAGALAPQLIAAHRVARPSLSRVLLWNRTRHRAEALATDLIAQGLEVSVVEDLGAAVPEADVICCATATRDALIAGAWLRPGQHLDLVGGFQPDMREADDEACRRAAIYVDSRWFTLEQCGDIAVPLANGAIVHADIKADLFELCRGERPGRQSPEQITLFKNGGGGHLDLMVAKHLVERHKADLAQHQT